MYLKDRIINPKQVWYHINDQINSQVCDQIRGQLNIPEFREISRTIRRNILISRTTDHLVYDLIGIYERKKTN